MDAVPRSSDHYTTNDYADNRGDQQSAEELAFEESADVIANAGSIPPESQPPTFPANENRVIEQDGGDRVSVKAPLASSGQGLLRDEVGESTVPVASPKHIESAEK